MTQRRTSPPDHSGGRGTLEFDPRAGSCACGSPRGDHEADLEQDQPFTADGIPQSGAQYPGFREVLMSAEGRSRGQREMSSSDERPRDRAGAGTPAAHRQRDRLLERIGVQETPNCRGKRPNGLVCSLARMFKPAGRSRLCPTPSGPPAPAPRGGGQGEPSASAARRRSASISSGSRSRRSSPSRSPACLRLVGHLGSARRRGGLAAGFLSAGFFIFYYLCLVGGEQLATAA